MSRDLIQSRQLSGDVHSAEHERQDRDGDECRGQCGGQGGDRKSVHVRHFQLNAGAPDTTTDRYKIWAYAAAQLVNRVPRS